MSSRSIPRHFLRLVSAVTLRSPSWERSWKHRAGRLGVYGLYGYLAFLLLLLSLEDGFLSPRGPGADWPLPPSGVPGGDGALPSRDGCRVHAWWAAPPGWEPGQ